VKILYITFNRQLGLLNFISLLNFWEKSDDAIIKSTNVRLKSWKSWKSH